MSRRIRKLFRHHVEATGKACAKCGKGTKRWYSYGQRPPDGHHVEACNNGCTPHTSEGTPVDGVIWRDGQRRRRRGG